VSAAISREQGVAVSVAMSIAVPVAVSVAMAMESVAIAIAISIPVATQAGMAVAAAIEQRGQANVQGDRHAFQRTETRQNAPVLNARDIGSRQLRGKGELLLGKAAILSPGTHQRGDVAMGVALHHGFGWTRCSHHKRHQAAAATIMGGPKLDQSTTLAPDHGT